jgi:hypothetical protein
VRRASSILFACLVVSVAACTSRTTPLPPPIPEVSSVSLPDATGNVTVTGSALRGASVGVLNEATLAGVIITVSVDCPQDTCEFSAVIAADSGTSLRVWQFFEVDGAYEAHVPELK